MQYLKPYLLLLCLSYSLCSSAQSNHHCAAFDRLLQEIDSTLDRPNFSERMDYLFNKLRSARIKAADCDLQRDPEVDERYQRMFAQIKEQKEAALAAERRAKKAEQEAHEQTQLATQAAKTAQTEKEKAQNLARVSHNAALAFRTVQKDPNLALRLAEYNMNEFPEESSASVAFHDIISDRDNQFYFNFEGHLGGVTAVAFSPDGNYILTGSRDNTAKLWTIKGEEVQSFEGHLGDVTAVTFSPDGNYILTGSGDKTAKLWTLKGEEVQTFEGHSYDVTAVAFSPKGDYILTGSRDNTAKLWTLKGEEVQTFEGHSYRVTAVAFSPIDDHILTGSGDQTAKLWSLDGKEIQSFEGHIDGVLAVDFSPKGDFILTGSWDNTAKLWTLKGEEIHTFEGHTSKVHAVDFSPKGDYILTGSSDNTAKLWTLKGQEVHTFEEHRAPVTAVAFSPIDDHILTGSDDQTAKLWTHKGVEVHTFEGSSLAVSSVAFSPDGNYMLTGSGNNLTKLWTLKGEEVQTFEEPNVTSVAFSPKDDYVLTSSGGAATLWTISGEKVQTFEAHKDYYNTSYETSPDGEMLVNTWANGGGPFITAVAFSPNGDYVLLTGSSNVKLWKLSGEEIQSFERGDVYAVAFSPKGDYILTGGKDNTAKLWKLSGEEIQTYSGHNATVNAVAFSPNGDYVVTGSDDKTVKLWRLSGEEIQTYNGHNAAVNAVAFSPNGDYVLTGSDDKTAKLWKLSGEEIQTYNGHNANVNAVAFSPNGDYVLTGSDDKTTKLWWKKDAFLKNKVGNFSKLGLLKAGLQINAKDFKDLVKKAEDKELAFLYWYSQSYGFEFDFKRLLKMDTDILTEFVSFFKQNRLWEEGLDIQEEVWNRQPTLDNLLKVYKFSYENNLPFDKNRLLKYNEVEQFLKIGNFCANYTKDWVNAAFFYEKSLKKEANLDVLLELYEVCDKGNLPFDQNRLLEYNEAEELEKMGNNFHKKEDWTMAASFYEKSLNSSETTEAYWKLYTTHQQLGKDSLGILLQSDSILFLEDFMKRFIYLVKHNADDKPSNYYAHITQLGEKRLQIQADDSFKKELAHYYNIRTWYDLLELSSTQPGLTIEQNLRRGLELDNNNIHLWRKLFIALLLQDNPAKFEEAKKLYVEYASEVYEPNARFPTFRAAFLTDFETFKKEGIDHPNFEKMRVLLEEGKD